MKFVLLILISVGLVQAEFDLQYIGDSLTNDEAQARDFCNTKYCIEDAQILFYSATQNASVDPCKDFKEFSMGTLIKYRALHERYFAVGMIQDVKKAHEERQRKTLSAEKKPDDARVFKILKNFFAKCVSSRYVRQNGRREIIDRLKSLGGSPYLDGDAWDPSKFNVSRIIEEEPFFGLSLLLDYDFNTGFPPDGWEKYDRIPVLEKKGILSIDHNEKSSYKQYSEMLSEMDRLKLQNTKTRETVEKEIEKAVERLKAFDEELVKHQGVSSFKIHKVSDLNELTTNLKINWRQLLNDQLLKSVSLKEDDEVNVLSEDSLKTLSLALDTIDKGIIADAFVLKYLYQNRFLFIVYPFDWRDEQFSQNTRPKQRWEQCLDFVTQYMRPGLEFLQSKSSERDSVAVEKFTRGVVNDITEKIKKLDESILESEKRDKAVEKLNAIVYLSELFAKNFTEKRLDEHYDELDLKGDESLVETAIKIKDFFLKTRNDYRDVFKEGSKSSIESAAQADLTSYNTLSDELRVPSSLTYYPWYHQDRPKFFNQATLYLDIFAAVRDQIVRYVGNVLFADALKLHEATDPFDFAYDNYVDWENNGGKDLVLGANRLSTRQLFWLALARSRYRKQKPGVSGIDGNDYERTFFWFKHKEDPLEKYTRFKEAFNCKKQ